METQTKTLNIMQKIAIIIDVHRGGSYSLDLKMDDWTKEGSHIEW